MTHHPDVAIVCQVCNAAGRDSTYGYGETCRYCWREEVKRIQDQARSATSLGALQTAVCRLADMMLANPA
jgi:hypothetical protein